MVPDGGVAFCACGRRLVAERTTSGGPVGSPKRKVYKYLICSAYSDSSKPPCEQGRSHRAWESEERVADFALGRMRDPATLRAGAERQAEGERRRLGRAGRLKVSRPVAGPRS